MSMLIAPSPKTVAADKEVQRSTVSSMDEFVAYCPKCKTFETLWFEGNVLMQTRKFSQVGSKIYHHCGSSQPCRLLPSFF